MFIYVYDFNVGEEIIRIFEAHNYFIIRILLWLPCYVIFEKYIIFFLINK